MDFDEDKLTKYSDFEAASKLGIKKDEYMYSYKYEGIETPVHLGMDDYGQSYFVVFELNGETKELGCGTYCDYMYTLDYVFTELLK